MQFLLEKLAQSPDLETAVAEQIQRIVSSRMTGMSAMTDFGMPSVVELASHSRSQLERYAAQLTRLIERYEPRLKQVQVQVHAASLVVSGMLLQDSDAHTFHFELPPH